MAVILAALVASQSRMGLVAGMVGVAVVIVIAAAGHRHAMRLVLAFGSLAVLLLGLMILFDGTGIFERFLFTSKDANFRLELYIKTLDLISLRPLAGQGAGSFLLAFPQVQAPPLNPDLTWDYAHNLYLELGAELGLPAALAVMLAVLLLAGRCLRAALRQSRGWTVPCAAFGVTVVAAVHSLADFSLQIESIVFLFLFVLGAGYAQSGQRKARSRGADSTKDVEFSGLPLDAHRGTPHV
jgi:O-antigen ligase